MMRPQRSEVSEIVSSITRTFLCTDVWSKQAHVTAVSGKTINRDVIASIKHAAVAVNHISLQEGKIK